MNKITLTGKVYKTPYPLTSTLGEKTMNFAIEENHTIHNVVCSPSVLPKAVIWNRGDKIEVEGKLVVRKWKDGLELKKSINVVANRIKLYE